MFAKILGDYCTIHLNRKRKDDHKYQVAKTLVEYRDVNKFRENFLSHPIALSITHNMTFLKLSNICNCEENL